VVPPSLEARVAEHCRRHALLPAGAPVLAMVSGGPDSTCLMHLLARLHDGPVTVLTVDHGLRPEAAREAGGVLDAAARLGLPARLERLGLAPGPGAPARARAARIAAAERVAAEAGAVRIATGHTAGDQAETVLFRMARGTGRTGALGMSPRRGAWIRPLLAVAPAETRAWCARHGLETVADPSNRDPAFARTRVREGLLPALRAVHPGAERHLAALADALRDEAELIAPLVDAAWARCARGEGLDAALLAGEPPPLRRLLARRLLEQAGLPAEARGAEGVARALAAAEDGRAADLPGGRVARERGRLAAHAAPAPAPPPAALAVPGAAPFGDALVRAEPGPAGPPSPDRVTVAVEGPLVVRGPAPGDRLPLAGGGHQAVGRLLAAAGVPARARPAVPVVATADRVVWVAGHRAAPDLLAPPGARGVVLRLERAGAR
jgi:tRNA(Ile)-lysidine synthase